MFYYSHTLLADDMKKAYSTLTSSKASLIKKRQTMNALFGDYRKKMAEEENKFRIGNYCLSFYIVIVI